MKLRPVPSSTGSLFAKDLVALNSFQRVDLGGHILIVGGNARETLLSPIDFVLQYSSATRKSRKSDLCHFIAQTLTFAML